MQNLLIFLAFGGVFIAGYVGFIKWWWSMMQENAAFDIMFPAWTRLKNRLYNGTAKQQLLENVLGGCEQCTSFWWALPWSGLYFIFCKSTGIWCIGVISSVIWFLVFISICSYLGLKTLTHKKDGV